MPFILKVTFLLKSVRLANRKLYNPAVDLVLIDNLKRIVIFFLFFLKVSNIP